MSIFYGSALIAMAFLELILLELPYIEELGLAVSIMVFVVYLYFGYEYKKKFKVLKPFFLNYLMFIIILLALRFLIFDKTFILTTTNYIVLFCLIILHLSFSFGILDKNKIVLKQWFMQGIKALVQIFNFISVFKYLNNASKGILQVIIGFTISMPIIFIMTFVLLSSDEAFLRLVMAMPGPFIFLAYIFKTILFFALFLPISGFVLYILKDSNKISLETTDSNLNIGIMSNMYVIVITIVTMICLIYILFIFSQFAYFISAFAGLFSEYYNVLSYFTSGFFEMIPLMFIQIILLIILNATRNNTKKRDKVIKVYSTFIVLFTLFVLTIALSKIIFNNRYGLTISHILLVWFIICSLLVLVFVGIKIFRSKFCLIRNLFVMLTLAYVLLNYANIDNILGKYNLAFTHNQQSYRELNLSAFDTYIEYETLYENIDNIKHSDIYDDFINDMTPIQDFEWKKFNFEMYRAYLLSKKIDIN
ncbi:hypothetical protein AN641_05960 [Candidatus Epulonipiscioides gigas]|nr:hypothetical protein AN641_05960 [Epulopiscium sp. SCG-C07WGA-EpuloA2]